jgi:ketosteroid isomerase-like protein
MTASPDRQSSVELAWRPWRLIGEGRVADGLAVLDDAGTWWEMSSRSEQPMTHIKAVLAEILAIVPMTFDLVGSVVEGHRVALMVESHGQVDDQTVYHNVYTFITEVDPARETIVSVREYVDTAHAANVLIPAVIQAVDAHGGHSALASMLGRR